MEQRLIDANALQLEPKNGAMNGVLFMGRATGKTLSLVQSCLNAMISNAPTVDAVEVVRCGRCKRGKAYKAWDGSAGFKCELLCVDIGVNDFCSYGERRDSDGNVRYCPNCGAKMDLEVTNGLDQH